MKNSRKALSDAQLMICMLNRVNVAIWFTGEAEDKPDYVGLIEHVDEHAIKTAAADYYVRSQIVVSLART
ncbi:hypothetical protein [Paenibacillus albus]|uniref:Uncharacterized protein n=1 Tax=Paenibacillus albus TaxID=2495582 RepID=A0A3S9A3V6_9BACL|nr:hypothetical protein [Paenibacillus albus]AZN40399.1 hypothetical protein EJC50_12625 [Paenibacillus albus]